ncbi:RNA polymerase sigma factor [Kineococcus sp. GCM10028916]|uniref:RNA polymerase sigma factor n=1 Tax=Kineococcus sp. GCM10028916 TaxID=3273394 RepID=UPI0036320EC7
MGTTVHADAEDRFAVLLDDVVEPVRRYLARRTDASSAEDVLSETLLVCWRRLDEVPVDAPVAWALGVTRNCLANARRSERRRLGLLQRILHLDPPGAAPSHAAPGRDASAEGAVDIVTVALGGLTDRDAELLRLWAWEELAPREIAVVLGVSVNAATVRLHRAKARLRARLSEGARTPSVPDRNGVEGGEEL